MTPYIGAVVLVNVDAGYNNGPAVAPALVTDIGADGKLSVRVAYNRPSHHVSVWHPEHLTEVTFYDTPDPAAANRQGLYGAFWPPGPDLATILTNQEKIMAAQDDVTAAAAAMVAAANTISTVAADLTTAQANVQTEIANLNAQIAAAGSPVDTTALNSAVAGLSAPIAALQAADTSIDALETPAPAAPAAPATPVSGSDTGSAA